MHFKGNSLTAYSFEYCYNEDSLYILIVFSAYTSRVFIVYTLSERFTPRLGEFPAGG